MIIRSLLDTDLYKFTMMQVVLHRFAAAQVQYRFKCRTPGVDLAVHAGEIRGEIDALSGLRASPEELDYLAGLRYIKPDFVDFLRGFRLDPGFVRLDRSREHAGEIDLVIEGPWLRTILFETPLLAIVNEVYFRGRASPVTLDEGRRRLAQKVGRVRQDGAAVEFRFSDFGTRRRFSRDWHGEVLRTLAQELPQNFTGTSNIGYAMQLGLTPVGTMAHEYLQAAQVLAPGLRESQRYALEVWAQEYGGELGIALSDVYGIDAFLRDFDPDLARLYHGARHDSGDPYRWGEKLIAHYRGMGIDPAARTLVFSDALTIDSALALARHFSGRARVAFGIGTHLTNDLGPEPIQIVIKMTACNGRPVAKLSDQPGKAMSGAEDYVAYLRRVFEVDTKS